MDEIWSQGKDFNPFQRENTEKSFLCRNPIITQIVSLQEPLLSSDPSFAQQSFPWVNDLIHHSQTGLNLMILIDTATLSELIITNCIC